MKKRIFILAALLSTGLIGSMTATTKSSHSEIMTKEDHVKAHQWWLKAAQGGHLQSHSPRI